MKAYQRVIRERIAEADPRPPLDSLDGCRVQRISREQAHAVIEQYEWLVATGRGGRGRVLTPNGRPACYGLLGPDGDVLGAVTFGRPAPVSAASILGPDFLRYAVCLERGACVHYAPKNAASFLIRHAVRLAHRDYGWVIFYAYSDVEAGEVGTVYQASNWIYLGQGLGRRGKGHALPGAARDEYHKDGMIISSKAMRARYGPGPGARARALAGGWIAVRRPDKHKYVWLEGPAAPLLREILAARYPALPFPKRDP